MSEPGASPVAQAFLAESRRKLSACHERIRHCVDQLHDSQLWWRPHPSMNSIANLVLHLCGNLQQWILSGVSGVPDVRNRPREFAEQGPIPRETMLERLAEVIQGVDKVLAGASDTHLLQPRRIQGFDETGLSAILDSLSHLTGHTQEIICLTRLQLGDTYRFAWVPQTPEQGAPEGEPVNETVALRDAVFGQGAVTSLRPEEPPPIPAQPSPDSPLYDPLFALEKEIQEESDGNL